MAAIASGSSWGRTFFHKEGKLQSNTEKYEKEISSSSLEKWRFFHLKSKGDEIGTISRESKKPTGAKYIRPGSIQTNHE